MHEVCMHQGSMHDGAKDITGTDCSHDWFQQLRGRQLRSARYASRQARSTVEGRHLVCGHALQMKVQVRSRLNKLRCLVCIRLSRMSPELIKYGLPPGCVASLRCDVTINRAHQLPQHRSRCAHTVQLRSAIKMCRHSATRAPPSFSTKTCSH